MRRRAPPGFPRPCGVRCRASGPGGRLPTRARSRADRPDINRPLRFEHLADDVAALLAHLGLEQADLLGFSLGGGVARQTAIRHAELVRKLVIISAAYKNDGWQPELLAAMGAMTSEVMVQSPMHEVYVSIAPKPED